MYECFQAKGLFRKLYDLYFPINNNACMYKLHGKETKWNMTAIPIPNLVMF